MDSVAFDKYRTERYQPQVAWYDRAATRSRLFYQSLQVPMIVLSVSAPVLVASGEDWKIVAIGVTAFVAAATSLLKVFKFQENWINYRSTAEALKKEIYFYEARVPIYRDTDDPEALFVERVESLIDGENTEWHNAQRRAWEQRE